MIGGLLKLCSGRQWTYPDVLCFPFEIVKKDGGKSQSSPQPIRPKPQRIVSHQLGLIIFVQKLTPVQTCKGFVSSRIHTHQPQVPGGVEKAWEGLFRGYGPDFGLLVLLSIIES